MNLFTHATTRSTHTRTLGAIAGAALLAGAGAPAMAAPESMGRETPEDSEIASTIGTDLRFNQRVDADKIDVSVNEGIVSLEGNVRTLVAKRRAIETARSIRGVRSVVDRVSVRTTNREDNAILEDVRSVINETPATDSYELRFVADAGVVTIRGTVDSRAEKMLAEDLVAQVKGVRAIENDVRVETSGNRADDEIRHDIEARLARDTRVDALPIDVEVDDGIVTLTGIAGSAAERLHAIRLSYVDGVEHVHGDELVVTFAINDDMLRSNEETNFEDDDNIADAINDALLYDPRVDSYKVTVSVNDGHATLTGTVPTISAYDAAERDARLTTGVERVSNLISVRVRGWANDADLAGAVRDAIRRDSVLDGDDIVMATDDGVVTLTGNVHTDYEKRQARRVVSRIPGVTDVANRIDAERDWTWQPDREIAEDVRDQLFWSPFVDSGSVAVAVDDGTVTLTGDVDSYSAARAAIDNAYQGGAKHVVSLLEF